jgi:hypothetical protein
MTDRELMQEALNALTYIGDKDIYSDTIDALRAALAQPEPVRVSPQEFIAAVTSKENLVGIPVVMSVWPTKGENNE